MHTLFVLETVTATILLLWVRDLLRPKMEKILLREDSKGCSSENRTPEYYTVHLDYVSFWFLPYWTDSKGVHQNEVNLNAQISHHKPGDEYADVQYIESYPPLSPGGRRTYYVTYPDKTGTRFRYQCRMKLNRKADRVKISIKRIGRRSR